jgi:hypothetical protein
VSRLQGLALGSGGRELPREEKTFVGDLRGRTWVLLAPSRAAAGRALHFRLPPADQNRKRPEGAARYVAPLCWCPEQEVLWFWVFRRLPPRLLHPARVPANAWAGITTASAPAELDRSFPCSRGKVSERVSAEDFQRRIAAAP